MPSELTIVRPPLRVLACAFALLLACASGIRAAAQQPSKTEPGFEDLLKKISAAPGDACEYSVEDFSSTEFHLFEQADKVVATRLNDKAARSARSTAGDSPLTRAIEALRGLERLSGEINKGWPDKKRFHFQVLDVPPALLVTMTYRNRATFSFFAIPDRDGNNKPAGIRRTEYAFWRGLAMQAAAVA